MFNLDQDRYREHPFLEIERTLTASKGPPHAVLLEGGSAEPRGHPSLPPPSLPPVRIPPNATSEQARALLSGLPDAVLHLEEIPTPSPPFPARPSRLPSRRR